MSVPAEAETANEPRTRLALLGTLGQLHSEPLRYDLACLRALVEGLEPDLLGVEAAPDAWQRDDLSGAPIEVRESLLPAARRTDTIIVPLGCPSPLELAPPAGGGLARPRAGLVRAARRLLTRLQRAADGPEGVNSHWFKHTCGLLCSLEAAAAGDEGRRAWDAANGRILERLLWLARRDPGRRVLVALQCRRIHWLETRLRALGEEIDLVPYQRL